MKLETEYWFAVLHKEALQDRNHSLMEISVMAFSLMYAWHATDFCTFDRMEESQGHGVNLLIQSASNKKKCTYSYLPVVQFLDFWNLIVKRGFNIVFANFNIRWNDFQFWISHFITNVSKCFSHKFSRTYRMIPERYWKGHTSVEGCRRNELR